MEEDFLETHVVEMDKFYPNTADPGEELTIYRRLADAYDSTAVTLRNASGDFIGYLDREVASGIVLPAIRDGKKYECIVVSKGEAEHTLSVRLRQYDPVIEEETTADTEDEDMLDDTELSDAELLADADNIGEPIDEEEE